MTTQLDDRPVRWGILGAGGIADIVARDIAITEGNVVHSVAARDAARAREFASRFDGCVSRDSYEELVADPDVDVVYVSTTHPNHRAHALLAIAAGKPVLIEKPVCLDAAGAREVFAAARAANVFAMEAMWMRCNPLIRRAQQLVADGAIGDVRGLRSEFGLGIPFDATHRLYDRDNGGGALLDLGVYPATFAYLFLGRPDEVRTSGALAPTAVDETASMVWSYDGEPRAQLWCSVPVAAPNLAAVLGTQGWIAFDAPAHRPSGMTLVSGDRYEHFDDPLAGQGTGYGPEIEEVAHCLRTGLLESPVVPQADTIAILELLDTARTTLGVIYPTP
jgi:predicted dehydrogenase